MLDFGVKLYLNGIQFLGWYQRGLNCVCMTPTKTKKEYKNAILFMKNSINFMLTK